MKRTVPIALVVVLAACGGNPEPDAPAPATQQPAANQRPTTPAFSPLGSYDFTTSAEGQTVNGVIEILRKDDGSYGGRLSTDMTGEIPVSTVAVEGMKVTINANMPDGALAFTMEFKNANEFTGNWSYAGMGGAFTGKRKS